MNRQQRSRARMRRVRERHPKPRAPRGPVRGRPARRDRWRDRTWSGAWNWFGWCVGLVAGLGMLTSAILDYRDGRALTAHGARATGEIVGLYHGGRSRPDARVRFTARDGRVVTTDLYDLAADDPHVGDPVRIRYDPADPEQRLADADDAQALSSEWLWGLGGVVVLAGAAYSLTRYRPGGRAGRFAQ